MTGGDAWDILGIAPTEDTRAIRRAYARQLKAIDVEADPQAFVALREAFEAAVAEAEGRARDRAWPELTVEEPADDDEDDGAEGAYVRIETGPAWEVAAPPAPPAPEPPPEPARLGPWAASIAEDVDQQIQLLVALLQMLIDADRMPGEAESSRMLCHWRAIVGDPRMQQVAWYADTEAWLSDLIARTIPVSNPLIEPAIAHFGWLKSEDKIDQTPAAAYIVHQYRSLAFVEALRGRTHPLHAAWRELTTPANEDSMRGRVDKRKVAQLLAIIRSDYPALEGSLDWYRIALWEGEGSDKAFTWFGRYGIALLIVGYIALRLLLSFGGDSIDTSQSRYQPPVIAPAPGYAEMPLPDADSGLGNPIPDIDRVLQSLHSSRLDVATLQTDNPALFHEVFEQWKASRGASETLGALRDKVAALMTSRYAATVRSADSALLADFHQLTLEMAKALQDRSPAQCDAFLRGPRTWNRDLPAEYRIRERGLIARVLARPLDDDGPDPLWGLPPSLLDTAAAHAGLSRRALNAAIADDADPAASCTARIAILETALETLDAASPLLHRI